MCYQKLIRPVLFSLPAEASHNVALRALHYYGKVAAAKPLATDPVTVMGVNFPNRVGLAAGLDKNAIALNGLAAFGFGFIEAGTVLPKPQPGNPKPRLFRLSRHKALINRFGFNSEGIDQFIENVQTSDYKGILGINIGKNKTTANEDAVQDYLIGLERAYPYASYVTVNISSPNTQGLRDLQQAEMLTNLLAALKQKQDQLAQKQQRYVPLVVKIAPDLTSLEITEIADILLKQRIDGVIATNTTVARPAMADEPLAAEQGGLSGVPLREKSVAVVTELAKQVKGSMAIIGCGGISSVADKQAMLDAGADLIQVYTGFIYQGPELIKQLVVKN
ncbi:MAG: quinone-dependent dihydroorotate dehydrogenase [Gammaproteobacteria bacterium]|nr:quinone-dependent dihydroorotate dehydrogenase [Gammaproteobacteria bacterium]